jgi:hypothetical protein
MFILGVVMIASGYYPFAGLCLALWPIVMGFWLILRADARKQG